MSSSMDTTRVYRQAFHEKAGMLKSPWLSGSGADVCKDLIRKLAMSPNKHLERPHARDRLELTLDKTCQHAHLAFYLLSRPHSHVHHRGFHHASHVLNV
mmetsp:Transcript_46578/g.134815  ORF Transcript_46578/g.134815 Transcript_46578/m.134815 type:complete len:99 (+) Transcript_46578:181-477(+)